MSGPTFRLARFRAGWAGAARYLSVVSVRAGYEGGMDDLLSLGPALLVPVLTGAWLATGALVALFVGRAVNLADRRSSRPVSR